MMLRRMGKAPNTGEIDFSGWGMDCNPLTKMFADAMSAMVKDALDASPPEVSLPYQYAPDGDGRHGPCPSDPLALYVKLPFGAYEEDYVEWQTTLGALLDEVVQCHQNGVTKRVDCATGVMVITDMSRTLRELADKLDASLDTSPRS